MARKPKTKPEAAIPNLSNATPEFLVDEIGRLRKHIKELEDNKTVLETALKARAASLEQYSFVGEVFTGELVNMSRSGIPVETIRKEMSEEWLQEHTVTTTYKQLNIKPRTDI